MALVFDSISSYCYTTCRVFGYVHLTTIDVERSMLPPNIEQNFYYIITFIVFCECVFELGIQSMAVCVCDDIFLDHTFVMYTEEFVFHCCK